MCVYVVAAGVAGVVSGEEVANGGEIGGVGHGVVVDAFVQVISMMAPRRLSRVGVRKMG